MTRALTLYLLPGDYAVARLTPDQPWPAWTLDDDESGGFVSLSRNPRERSVICRSERVPAGVQAAPGWACLHLAGPFAFDEAGILAAALAPLAAAGIGVMAVSTWDDDHLLIARDALERATRALAEAGHRLLPAALD